MFYIQILFYCAAVENCLVEFGYQNYAILFILSGMSPEQDLTRLKKSMITMTEKPQLYNFFNEKLEFVSKEFSVYEIINELYVKESARAQKIKNNFEKQIVIQFLDKFKNEHISFVKRQIQIANDLEYKDYRSIEAEVKSVKWFCKNRKI